MTGGMERGAWRAAQHRLQWNGIEGKGIFEALAKRTAVRRAGHGFNPGPALQTAIREWAYASSIRTQGKEIGSCLVGSMTITGTDHMLASISRPPSAAQSSMSTTS